MSTDALIASQIAADLAKQQQRFQMMQQTNSLIQQIQSQIALDKARAADRAFNNFNDYIKY